MYVYPNQYFFGLNYFEIYEKYTLWILDHWVLELKQILDYYLLFFQICLYLSIEAFFRYVFATNVVFLLLRFILAYVVASILRVKKKCATFLCICLFTFLAFIVVQLSSVSFCFLCVYLSVCLFVCWPNCLSACLSVGLFVCRPVCL